MKIVQITNPNHVKNAWRFCEVVSINPLIQYAYVKKFWDFNYLKLNSYRVIKE